jgi:hypothetical protein
LTLKSTWKSCAQKRSRNHSLLLTKIGNSVMRYVSSFNDLCSTNVPVVVNNIWYEDVVITTAGSVFGYLDQPVEKLAKSLPPNARRFVEVLIDNDFGRVLEKHLETQFTKDNIKKLSDIVMYIRTQPETILKACGMHYETFDRSWRYMSRRIFAREFGIEALHRAATVSPFRTDDPSSIPTKTLSSSPAKTSADSTSTSALTSRITD